MKKIDVQPSYAKAKADKGKKCVNLDYLNTLTQNNSESTAEMIDIYLEETPTLVNAMKQAIDNKNWETLERAAHSILPSFSIMGMDKECENSIQKIQKYASDLHVGHFDVQTKKKNVAKLNVLILKIETACAQAYKELQKELLSLRKTRRTH